MIDPFTAATGIAGILSLTLEVSKILYKQVSTLKNAPKEAKELLHELGLIERVLTSLEDFLRSEKARGNSFKETSVLAQATSGLSTVVNELRCKVQKPADGHGLSQMIERGKWYLKGEEHLKLIGTLHRYLGMFQISLNVDGMYVTFTYNSFSESPYFHTANSSSALLSKSVDDMAQDMKHVIKTISILTPDPQEAQKKSQQFDDILRLLSSLSNNCDEVSKMSQTIQRWDMKWQDQENRDIVAWLSPLNFKRKQNDVFTVWHEGTGNWLLGADAFKDWMEGASGTLWCPGIPGAGKTVLTSMVVNHLIQSFQYTDVGIAYIYCNYKEEISQTTVNLLSSLLQQLVESQPAISDEVKSLYKYHQKGSTSTRPTVEECSRLLRSEFGKFSTVYIIIDALDECPEERRQIILDEIRKSQFNVKLLVTSRHIATIERHFEKEKRLEIRASDEDIQKYLQFRITNSPRLARHTKRDSTLEGKIITTVVEKANGMFLLAQLHMDSLARKASLGEVRNALSKLPKELDKTYDEALQRIESQHEDDVRIAKIVLRWISFAIRPLTIQEVQHALAVEQQGVDIGSDWMPDGDFLSDEDVLVSVCAGLVIIDQESNIIRLVHYTTQAYFEHFRTHIFPDGHKSIAMTCVIYISLDYFAEGYCETDEILETRLQRTALFKYAARSWGIHAHGVTEQTVQDLVLKFLMDDSKVSSSSQVLFIPEYQYSGYSQGPPKQFPGINLVAYFGLKDVMAKLLSKNEAGPCSKDSSGRTPLSWAAARGHTAVAELLVNRQDVAADSKDVDDRTPLSWAAENGHTAMVELLVNRQDVAADSKDVWGRTPLSRAAAYGHTAVVELLVNRQDVAADSKDVWGRTPLSWAAAYGHTAVAELLVNRQDVAADSKDEEGRTPLSWAAENGHTAVAELLVNRQDVAADSRDGEGRTPLSWAAARGHTAVAELLVNRQDVAADSKDKEGGTPLSWAAAYGHTAVVELLVNRQDVAADSKDVEGGTPLSRAAAYGHTAVVELLVNRQDVAADSKDVGGRTPLWWAAAYGHTAVVELLVNRQDVAADSKDEEGRTPLWWAAAYGHTAVIELLVNRQDVAADSKDEEGRTPLSRAAAYGHTAVAELLVNRQDVAADSKDEEGRTPLSWAAENGHTAVAELLERHKPPPPPSNLGN